MIARTVSCVLGFVVAQQVVPDPPVVDLLGYTVFATVVGAIVGLAKLAEVVITRKTAPKNQHNSTREVHQMAACLQRIEEALTAQTAILALMQERQGLIHQRTDDILRVVGRLERKSA
jgi:hypothetical protein